VSKLVAHDGITDDLLERLDAAVAAESPAQATQEVKAILQESLRCGALALPDRFRQTRPDTYARRLLYRDPAGRYTIVVMAWAPSQGTPLHDHAGIWCVECVCEGDMEVVQYDLVSESAGAYRFEEQSRVHAGRGSAGCLIPPFEYHTLTNIAPTPSITMHVYGGEMDHCHVFERSGIGTFRRLRKDLAYHD
jgi:3-mercaptopropionate dioxygenase